MPRKKSLDRRTYLKYTGAVSLPALVAGCGDEGPGETEEDEEEDGDVDDEDVDDEAWEGVDEFYFEGRIAAWTGIEPEIIAGVDNPDLVLFEGQEYDFRWINEDGAVHNIAMHDENEDVVDDYATEGMGDEGEEQTLENVVASEEMVTYICEFHPTTQVGDLEIITN
ncbi:cupredoxin domain-containing protein [Natrialba swarupiae]|uniref:PKD domain-containing protein n=1 Tax=Natrialba swarupiae TaxID=2448032 RepID=A0A5D5AI80_9EURY|nr:PKD domain-containing protein [Natrialba swarupiae]TYT60633.1 PKD domain-containing protein [Natrialba swarupiae]